MDMQYQYLVGKLQQALAADVRVSTLDIKVVVAGGRIHLTGEVGTEERRAALDEVVASVLPGTPIQNEVTVMGLAPVAGRERIHG